MASHVHRSEGESLTIHSSWRGIVSALLAGSAVSLAGALAVWRVGWRLVPSVVLAVGVVLLLVALFDFPISATFDRAGVRRRMCLRSHHIPWEKVRQFTRTRPSMSFAKFERTLVPGGLALVIGRRKYLLVDQLESSEEFDALDDLLGDVGEGLGMFEMLRPREGVTPTWLYRRKRWHPESSRTR